MLVSGSVEVVRLPASQLLKKLPKLVIGSCTASGDREGGVKGEGEVL